MYIVGGFSSDHLLFCWQGPSRLQEITAIIYLKRQKAFCTLSSPVNILILHSRDIIMEHI